MNLNTTARHIDYLDKIKAFACFLVVIGHFIMSMDASNIVPYNNVSSWFVDTIYFFHVPLFFLCSGFVYTFSVNIKNNYNYFLYALKKLLVLGVPYFTFTIITVLMKYLARDSVNSEADGLLYTLFVNPTAPYWYLYVLFFLFLFIPPLKSRKAISTALVISLTLKLIQVSGVLININLPYFITGIMKCSIWFVLGMAFCIYEYKPNKKFLISGSVIFVAFWVLSIIKYHFKTDSDLIAFFLGLIAVVSIFIIFSSCDIKTGRFTKFLIKYNLPIFLMHTIFAAGVRIVLQKIGLNSWYIQIPCGLIASFAGPAIAAIVMKKTKILEFFIYPSNFVKIPNKLK